MKKLFKLLTKSEVTRVLNIAAKVIRIFHIVTAFIGALFWVITGVMESSYSSQPAFMFILCLLAAGATFFITLLLGIYAEALILSISIITKNQYEELVLKNKAQDEEDTFKNDYQSTYEKLHQLNELRKNNIINEEDYLSKKEEILKRL